MSSELLAGCMHGDGMETICNSCCNDWREGRPHGALQAN